MTDLSSAAPLPGIESHPGSGHYGIYDHGAQVWAWQPDSQQPVLWLSSATQLADGKAIRGGIPICFPWFGPGLSGEMTPAHGFVRTTPWRREKLDETDDSLTVTYLIDPSITGRQPLFPSPYEARLTARFSAKRLEVSLRVDNRDCEPFTVEEALHTYLAVSDVTVVTINGLHGAAYLDKVAGDQGFDNEQSGSLVLTGPTDRVYKSAGHVTVDDPGYERRLIVSSSGASNVVVWNPWSSGAATIADIGAGEWQRFVCVEAANAYADAVTLLPGEHWTISQCIEIASLDD
ncbi:D-hexose-6-phosphate mutarotase [Micropruina sp.]|uniref:D-hexose-6-phosphate mutarotase n=1 Tax=Micropruina sp. TaxID=2737536 RepID=UPI0039E250BF